MLMRICLPTRGAGTRAEMSGTRHPAGTREFLPFADLESLFQRLSSRFEISKIAFKSLTKKQPKKH
jgi:hypothetical protein